MLSKTLIKAQVSTGTGVYGSGVAGDAPSLKICDADYFQGTLQVSIVGTATVTVFGRAAPTLPWLQVAAPITVSGFTTIPVLAEMYASVTAWTAGAVDVALNYPCNS
jgi:hypothetical protein